MWSSSTITWAWERQKLVFHQPVQSYWRALKVSMQSGLCIYMSCSSFCYDYDDKLVFAATILNNTTFPAPNIRKAVMTYFRRARERMQSKRNKVAAREGDNNEDTGDAGGDDSN